MYKNFNPYETVYAYVSVSVVRKLIQMNGGVKSGEVPPLAEVNDDYGVKY